MAVKKKKTLSKSKNILVYLSTVEPGTGGFGNFLKGRSLSGWNHYESTNADNYYFVCKIVKYRIPIVTIGRLAVYCTVPFCFVPPRCLLKTPHSAFNNLWAACQSKCRLRVPFWR
jgi:hypothetical protein